MISAKVVEKSVTNSSFFQKYMYLHPYDHTTDTHGFSSCTMAIFFSTSGCIIISFNFVSQLQAKLAKLMVEKEKLMKAVELSSDSCNEKGEQEIKVQQKLFWTQSGSHMVTIYV